MTHTHDTHCHHHFEWGVIFGGTAVATAFSIVLLQFGSIIGLSSDAALNGYADLTHWSVISIALWIMAVQLASSAAGGYMAGRLRAKTPDLTLHENEVRDGFYGLTVWAASTILVFAVVGLGTAFAAMTQVQIEDTIDLTPELMDKEQNATIIFAFILGATSLVSAVLAWAASNMGGHHRDSGIDHSHKMTFRGR